MLDDDTYQLLEEQYGSKIKLYDMIGYIDKEAVLRLLDNIIEDCQDFPDEFLLKRTRGARRRVEGA